MAANLETFEPHGSIGTHTTSHPPFTSAPQQEDSLRKVIQIAHDNGAYVSTGGFIEKLLATSNGDKAVVDRYLTACKKMGFDVVELSSGFLTMPAEDWKGLVDTVVSHGLKAKPEIGIQLGAGGDTAAGELEAIGTRDPAWLVDRAKLFLDAGADTIMIESEGITENVKSYRSDVISAITSNLPTEKVMFEGECGYDRRDRRSCG